MRALAQWNGGVQRGAWIGVGGCGGDFNTDRKCGHWWGWLRIWQHATQNALQDQDLPLRCMPFPLHHQRTLFAPLAHPHPLNDLFSQRITLNNSIHQLRSTLFQLISLSDILVGGLHGFKRRKHRHCTHIHAHARTDATDVRTNTMHTHSLCMNIHARNTHVCTRIPVNTRKNIYTRTHFHRACAYMQDPHMYAYTSQETLTHTHTHALTLLHAHTHTHTHTRKPIYCACTDMQAADANHTHRNPLKHSRTWRWQARRRYMSMTI